jgi:hypothetical protein
MKIEMSFDEILDNINLASHTTKNTKSVKLRESTYNTLLDIKKNNNFRSIDDVIVKCVTLVALTTISVKD